MKIPIEIENIILDYKNELNKYEKEFDKIEELLCTYNPNWIKTDLNYLDFKEFLIKKNINTLRFQIKDLYGKNHINNNRFWNLNFHENNDEILKEYRIKYIIYSHINQIFYLKFE
jgi:hypothetical protein